MQVIYIEFSRRNNRLRFHGLHDVVEHECVHHIFIVQLHRVINPAVRAANAGLKSSSCIPTKAFTNNATNFTGFPKLF